MALQHTMMDQCIIRLLNGGDSPPAYTTHTHTLHHRRTTLSRGRTHRSSPRQPTKAPQYPCTTATPQLVVKRKRAPVDIRARRFLSRRLAALMAVQSTPVNGQTKVLYKYLRRNPALTTLSGWFHKNGGVQKSQNGARTHFRLTRVHLRRTRGHFRLTRAHFLLTCALFRSTRTLFRRLCSYPP